MGRNSLNFTKRCAPATGEGFDENVYETFASDQNVEKHFSIIVKFATLARSSSLNRLIDVFPKNF
jgi:hypothetical protein